MTQDKLPSPPVGGGRVRLEIPSRLYGRTQAVGALSSAFDRVCQGNGTIFLIPGNSGSGKTSLVRAIRAEVENRNGLFLEGKFNQYHQNIPYSAIRSILREFCRTLSLDEVFSREYWSPRLQEAVGGLGSLMTELTPELEPWLGKQPPVAEINPLESRLRFTRVLRQFLTVLCRPEHPVVMFLDDMQWADAASVDLLTKLRIGSDLRFLLAVATYRDEEVDADHPLVHAIEELQRESVPVEVLAIRNLTQKDMCDLLRDTLKPSVEELESLSELLHRHTAGNPFFARTLLGTLNEQRLLFFDPNRDAWRWSAKQLGGQLLPESVVKLFAEKIRHLASETAELLSLAACLGNQFELSILAMISEHTVEECRRLLEPALADGLLLSLETDASPKEYRFLHDRVQQAAFDLIPPAERPQLRLRVGRQLRAQLSPQQLSDRLFQVADHVNAGLAFIRDAGEQVEVLRLNAQAARSAGAATAYGAALQFHRAAAGFLDQPGFAEKLWAEHHDVAYCFFLDCAESEFLEGDRTIAEACVRQAVAHADNVIEKANALNTLIVQFTLLARYADAIAAGREALASLGILLPEDDYEAARDAELASFRDGLRNRAVAELADLPVMSDPEMCTAVRLLITMGPPCYRSHQRLWSVIVPKVVNLTMRHGNLPQIGYSHPAFGGLIGWVSNDYALTKEFSELATRLMTGVFDSPSDRSVFYLMIGSSVRHWCEPLQASSRDYAQAYEIGLASGNLQYAAYAFGHNMYCRLYQGTPLPELIQETEHSLAFSRTRVNEWAIDLLEGGLKIFRGLSGEGTDPDEDAAWDEQYLRQVTAHRNIQVECIYKVNRALALLMLGKCESALAWSDQAEPLIYTVGTQGLLPWAEHVFVRALILARLIPHAEPKRQEVYREELARRAEQLRVWADACPENFAHKRIFVGAEVAVLERRWADALRLFRDAAGQAAAGGFVHWEGLAHERAAEFLETRSQGRLAQTYWQEAFRCYEQWGATAKLRAMETAFGERFRADQQRMPTDSGLEESGEQEFRQGLRDEHRRQLLIRSKLVQVVKTQAKIRSQAAELAEALDRLRQEVAERKRMEQSLQQANERLELAKQAASQGIWDWNIVTDEQIWSPEMFRLFGLDRETHTASFAAWETALHPADRAAAYDSIQKSLHSRTDIDTEYRVVHRGGQIRWIGVIGKAVYDDDGRALRMTGVCMDITDRREMLEKTRQWNVELERTVAVRTADLTRANEQLLSEMLQRQEAEESLRNERRRLADIIEADQAGTWEWNVQTGETIFNQRWAQIVGYALEELSPTSIETWIRLSHPDDLRASGALLEKHFRGELDYYDLEVRMKHKDGSWVWVRDRGQVITWTEQGEPLWMRGTHHDITQQKNTEAALLASEARFRAYVDQAADALFVHDATGRFLDVNPQACASLGYSREELLRMSVFNVEMGGGVTQAQAEAAWRQLIPGEPVTMVGLQRRKDGSTFPGEIRVGCFELAGERRYLCLARDITERRQREVELERVRNQLAEGQRIAHLGTWEYVVATHETVSSDEQKRIFGLNPDRTSPSFETIIQHYIHPEDAAKFAQRFQDAIQSGEIFEFENRIVRPDGDVRFIYSKALPYSDASGELIRYLGVTLDTTERREMEEQLRQLNVQLEHKVAERTAELTAANSAKSEFLANMSHEIRTPMNGVIGMTGLLLDTLLTSEQQRYAQSIRASGESMLTLINDILDISRIEAGKLQLETIAFELPTLLGNCAAPLAHLAREKGLEFTWEAAPEIPAYVFGDPGRLRQILNNLVGNAVKFTEKGQVTVRASFVAETETELVVRFAIRDTGIGIPADKQAALFQRFSQVDASATRRFGGTGLGLAIAKELAELMGGEIGVNSQPGIGSEFWFTVSLRPVHLPILNDASAQDRPESSPAAFPRLQQTRARILVAEDNSVNQEVAIGILSKLGVQADAVADGAAAIEALKRVPYDLVLMDVQMPELDGLEATRIIRNPQSAVMNHQVPVIAMTANAMRGDRERCLEAGMNDYVSKPVSPRALAEALNAWLPSDAPETRFDAPAEDVLLSESTPDVPILDRAGLVARLMGDEALADRILARFLETTPPQLESLRKSLGSGEAVIAKRTAHTIKGAASNIGGERLRQVAFAMEQAAHAGDLQAAASHLAELQSQFAQLKEAIQAT